MCVCALQIGLFMDTERLPDDITLGVAKYVGKTLCIERVYFSVHEKLVR